jgi:hypothetical protein
MSAYCKKKCCKKKYNAAHGFLIWDKNKENGGIANDRLNKQGYKYFKTV